LGVEVSEGKGWEGARVECVKSIEDEGLLKEA
jgi:hypothetical protein